MTETLDVIAARYSVRNFADKAVPREVLDQIADAALRAPSARDSEPWHFIFVTDPTVVAQMEEYGLATLKATDQVGYERTLSRGGKLYYGAPVLLVITAEPREGIASSGLDVGIAVGTIAIAAKALGVDSCIVASIPGAIIDRETQGPYAQLNIPAGHRPAMGILLGYEAGEPRPQHAIHPEKVTFI
ncbi:MAG: nitroreductase family protein [Propionibacteriaceae bacterium]|nr:nitroreductase family protein [Propionibacteriaceae bacterium]